MTPLVLKKELRKLRIELDVRIVQEVRLDECCQHADGAQYLKTECTSKDNQVILTLVQ
jgi:hypothetical protein